MTSCYGLKIIIVSKLFPAQLTVVVTVMVSTTVTNSVSFILIITLQEFYCNAGMYIIAIAMQFTTQ